jgi:membrane protease YdiL (CAAX protease family)
VQNDGALRPGWRVLAYFFAFAVLALGLGTAANAIFHGSKAPGSRLRGQFIAQMVVMVAALIPGFVLARIERRPFGDYGLPAQRAFRGKFWIGALWGFAGLSVLLLAISLSGDYHMGNLAQHGLRAWKFCAFWAAYFLGVGFFEEFLFRGYALFTLGGSKLGFWPSAVLLSTIFGAAHLANLGEAAIGAFAAGLIGLFFCFTVRRTGDLWFAVGFHASWDWGESFFYSVPDSGQMSPGHLLNSSFQGSRWITGGTIGPEGSVWVLAVILLLWVAFDRFFPPRTEAPRGVVTSVRATLTH